MYVGIDLGTSSVKAILVDRDGNVVKTSTREYPIYMPKVGYSEQNPSDWINKTDEVLAEEGKRRKVKVNRWGGEEKKGKGK